MKKRKDLTGMTFNKLTVIGPADDYISPTGKHSPQWECECSCAEHNRVIVRGTALTGKKHQIKSCGCERRKPDKGLCVLDNKQLASEWDYQKNIENPCNVALHSNIQYYWICPQCKYNYLATPAARATGTNCPVCANKICVTGINDIVTQYQKETDVNRKNKLKSLIDHFPNKEKDAALYTPSMTKKTIFQCLDCGHLQDRRIYNVFDKGFSCELCSDGISYPNKFAYALIEQLPVTNIKREWSEPDWLQINKRKCQYDLYFIYKNNEYVVEMDGGVGHGFYQYGTTEKDVEGKQRDIEKDRRAKEHNITVVRIDCYYTDILNRAEYIKKNIVNSLLNDIFDLSSINWSDCDAYAQSNLIREICKYKTLNPNVSVKDLSKMFNVAISTTYKYLRKGAELGWCDELQHSITRPLIQMDLSGNIIAYFDNAAKADKIIWGSDNNRGCGILKSCKTHKPYKGFLFRFEDDPNKLDVTLNYCTLHSNNTSGIIGVYFDKDRQLWMARITVNAKTIRFPRRKNKDDAIRDRLQAEAQYYGEFAPQKHLFEQYNITTIQSDY